MQQVNVLQGSREWLELRATTLNASEAPAMLGLSLYQSRADLLKQKHTGLADEPDQAALARFARGHQAEAEFRPIAEAMTGEDLYPIVGMIELDGLHLLASFDGMTMLGDVIFEHKLWNVRLSDTLIQSGDLPDTHWPQVEHQLLVSGADKCLFVTSDGTDVLCKSLWYRSTPERRARLIAGWKQFEDDLKDYAVPEAKPDIQAATPLALPYLDIRTEGRVLASNLDAFKASATAMIDGIKTELVTDQDFADAEAMTKHLKDGEQRITQAKDAALAQTASIAELFRALDDVSALMRDKRLLLEKRVKSEKDNRKLALIDEYASRLNIHETSLNVSMAGGYLAMSHKSVFADCIKGKSKLESMENALHSRLLELQSEATANATSIKNMLDAVEQAGVTHLFADMERMTCNPLDSEAMTALIASRKSEDDKRIAMIEERARLQAEEKARQAAAREAAQAKAEDDMKASQVLPVIHSVSPVQRTDADLVREFMKQRGIDDSKTRAVLVEFIRYVRANDTEQAA